MPAYHTLEFFHTPQSSAYHIPTIYNAQLLKLHAAIVKANSIAYPGNDNSIALGEIVTMADYLEQNLEAVEALSLVVSEPLVANAKTLMSALEEMQKQVSWMQIPVVECLLITAWAYDFAYQIGNVNGKSKLTFTPRPSCYFVQKQVQLRLQVCVGVASSIRPLMHAFLHLYLRWPLLRDDVKCGQATYMHNYAHAYWRKECHVHPNQTYENEPRREPAASIKACE